MKQFYFFFLFAFLMPLTLWAEEREYTDTEYHVNYTYDTEGTTAIVKRGNGNVTTYKERYYINKRRKEVFQIIKGERQCLYPIFLCHIK